MSSSGPDQTRDDLLSGFEQAGAGRGELRAYFTTTLIASLYVFDTTFHLGAYHAVFYRQLQHVAILSVVVLIGLLFIRRRVRVHAWVLAPLVLPFLLFVFRIVTKDAEIYGRLDVVEEVLTILNYVAAPIVLWVIARFLAPDYFALPGLRLKVAVVVTLIVVGGLGYAAGAFNNRTLTCQDFVTAGDDPPKNCAHVSP